MIDFYTLDVGCDCFKDITRYEIYKFKAIELFSKFSFLKNIKADSFTIKDGELYIVDNPYDEQTFKNVLVSNETYLGYKKFNKRSKIFKEWKKMYEESGLVEVDSLDISKYIYSTNENYIDVTCHYEMVDDKVYMAIITEDPYEVSDGFIKMKGSDFYKVMEENKIDF